MKRDAKRRRDEATRDGAGTFPATLTRRELIAQDTYELDFDLLGESIDFAAGQYSRIQLPTLNAPDKKGSRKFSFVNAPHDNRRVVIATRSGISGFKCTLCALQPGIPATVHKVKGGLRLPERPKRPTVLIGGGIGVVPFVSMLRDLDHRDRLADVTLLYLNRDPRSAAYLAELEELSRRRPGFRLVLSMTRHEGWAGETERFGHGLLGRLVEDISGWTTTSWARPAWSTPLSPLCGTRAETRAGSMTRTSPATSDAPRAGGRTVRRALVPLVDGVLMLILSFLEALLTHPWVG